MPLSFPTSFSFGIADADIQVIGEQFARDEEGSEQSMWDYFTRTFPEKNHNGETPDRGIDRYHLWKEDIEIMKSLGVRDYRTSVSMSRILKSNGEINEKAIDWYRTYFTALRAAGITIYVTIYHWELPQFLSEKGGWKNRAVLDAILKHTEAVVTHLGEYIDEYFLFNEPRHISFRSYYDGIQAPGETDLAGALLAAHHVNLAHGLTYEAIRKLSPDVKISSVINMSPCYPYSDDPADIAATKIADQVRNGWFGDPLYFGTYPEEARERFREWMPEISPEDMKVMKVGANLHAMAINYYKGAMIQADPESPLGYRLREPEVGEKNDLGWAIYKKPELPEGLCDIMVQTYERYKSAGLRELYLAENGMALKPAWDGISDVIDDQPRIEYLKEHLRQLHSLIERDIPITKYFLWTLMDNFEWTFGYSAKSSFGIVYVDQKTMKRVYKKSAWWYRDLLKTHTLPS